MANTKISDLTTAGALAGTEVLPIVQSATTKKVTATVLSDFAVANIPDASETVKGKIEIATQAETNTGTDDVRAVTPLKLATNIATLLPIQATETTLGIAELATQAETDTGTDDLRIVTPLKATTWWTWLKTQIQTISAIWTFSVKPLLTKLFTVGESTPATITGNQNNYNISALNGLLRLATDASRNITGFTAGASGDILYILNVGSFNIVFQNESASSTSTNRFTTSAGADMILFPAQWAKCYYDSTTTRWKITQISVPEISTVNIQSSATTSRHVVTGVQYWLGLTYFLTQAWTWALKQIFTTAPRFSSVSENQFLKVDASKDLSGVDEIGVISGVTSLVSGTITVVNADISATSVIGHCILRGTGAGTLTGNFRADLTTGGQVTFSSRDALDAVIATDDVKFTYLIIP